MFYSQLTFVLQPVLKDKYIALMHGKYKNFIIHSYTSMWSTCIYIPYTYRYKAEYSAT